MFLLGVVNCKIAILYLVIKYKYKKSVLTENVLVISSRMCRCLTYKFFISVNLNVSSYYLNDIEQFYVPKSNVTKRSKQICLKAK